MHYANTYNRTTNPRLLVGSFIYAIVCGSGVGAAGVVLFFLVTSFFAFIYVILNAGPRSFGAMLLSLIPVVGALLALNRLLTRAFKQVVAGFFFYLFPLFFAAAPIQGRILGSLLGGTLFYAFFEFVPGVRNNPRATFMFMWALPTIFFFIILAFVMPFIGKAADVDTGDFDAGPHDFGDGGDGFYGHHQTSFEGSYLPNDSDIYGDHASFGHDRLFDYTAQNSSPYDHHDFSTEHEVHAAHHDFGSDFSVDHNTGFNSHDQFDVMSYPDQTAGLGTSHATWLDAHFDPTSGRISIEGTHGNFDLFVPSQGELVGYNPDGQMIHFSHNPETHTITMTGPDGPRFLLQDQATGAWTHTDANGMTVIKNDPVTGWTHVRGPDSEMTIKFNPYNNTATGTGSEAH